VKSSTSRTSTEEKNLICPGTCRYMFCREGVYSVYLYSGMKFTLHILNWGLHIDRGGRG
jgi:hypothetical protein